MVDKQKNFLSSFYKRMGGIMHLINPTNKLKYIKK